jgi:hypothetical protein
MRTTLTLETDLATALTAKAERTGLPFEKVVNAALRIGLEADMRAPPKRAFGLRAGRRGQARGAVVHDQALRVADEREVDELARKLGLVK